MKYLLIITTLLFIGCGNSYKDRICQDCGTIIPVPEPIVQELETCPDTRNGDFNLNYLKPVCNSNGYFWCPLASQCLNKPENVLTCGEIGSEKRRNLNE